MTTKLRKLWRFAKPSVDSARTFPAHWRQKWFLPTQNLNEVDAVLVTDSDASQRECKLHGFAAVQPENDGLVRVVDKNNGGLARTQPITWRVMDLLSDLQLTSSLPFSAVSLKWYYDQIFTP